MYKFNQVRTQALNILVLRDGTLLTCSDSITTIQRWTLEVTCGGGGVDRQFRLLQTYHQKVPGVPTLAQWDEEYFVNSTLDGRLMMRKIESGEIIHAVSTHYPQLVIFRRLKHRNMLVTTNKSREIKLWSVSDKHELSLSGTLSGDSNIGVLCELESSGLLVVGSFSRVDLWNLDTKESIKRISGLPEHVRALAEVEGGVAFVQYGIVWFWNLKESNSRSEDDNCAKSLKYSGSSPIISLSRNRNILCLLCFFSTRSVKFWDVSTGTTLATHNLSFNIDSITELTSKRHVVVGSGYGLQVIPVPSM